jgi:O-antigen/teichoic acid export membrane protein
MVTLALSHPITALIFGARWLPALPLFYLFCFGNLFVPCSTPMLGVLNALGESRKTLHISLIWMGTTWALGVPLTLWLGIMGFGIAMIGVQLTNLVLYWMVWKITGVTPWSAYLPSWPVSIAVASLLVLSQMIFPARHIAELLVYGATGLGIYSLVLWFVFPGRTRKMLRKIEVQQ